MPTLKAAAKASAMRSPCSASASASRRRPPPRARAIAEAIPTPMPPADIVCISMTSGIAPNVLSERLKILEEHGIVAREFYSEHPPRAAYALTPRGRDLGMVVGALAVWGSRHVHKDTALVHDDCDGALELKDYCPKCDARGSGRTLHLRTSRRTPRPARRARRAAAR